MLFPQALAHIPDRAWIIVQRDWNLSSGGGENPLDDVSVGEEFRPLFEYLSYVASRESKPEGAGRNRLLGHYMVSMIYLTD